MVDVVMPQMGESIVEGTLTKWLKKPGDPVNRDEPLFEISTDKVDSEIPCPAAGVLAEILVAEGSTVAINTVVGRISEGQEAVVAKPATQPAAAPPPPPAPAAAQVPPMAASSPMVAPVSAEPPPPPEAAAPAAAATEVDGPLSPLVRRMARENNIDLAKVRGTGMGGRITKQDLEAHISARTAPAPAAAPVAPAAVAPAPPPPAPAAAAAPAPPPAPAAVAPPAPAVPAKSRVEALSVMRQKIAEHMVFSKHTSAHVTTVHKVDMTKIVKLREKSKVAFQERYGFGLTYLPFIVRAAADALKAFPIVNASIDGKNLIYHNDINVGIAVALEGGYGLIVPVIKNADEKNVVGLQRSIVDLANRARSKQLKPDDVQGGTFSITNFGTYGSIFATPVINQPQVAILGVGSVEKVPTVVEGDAIAIRSIAHLALTFDHRLIDGAIGDQFCQKMKSVLESWSEQVL
ncbi:MAG: dihydrolipoamide acetyltransferase family protein [Bryobacteraceae bacterium]